MSAPALEVQDLVREYVLRVRRGRFRRQRRVVRAVDGLSLRVERGESVGFIGANGAGKSTTVKLLTGILVPTSGTVRTCGLDPAPNRRDLARRIGVVFGQRSQLWWDLPLAESFRLLAAIHGLPGARWRARRDELADRLDMDAFLGTPVRQLSLGQRMRGEVAAALLHSPELLLLDEPTIGLDVLSSERLRRFLRSEREAHGTTLLLTTHDMGDVQRLCDRVLVVDSGRLAYDGDLPGLARRVGARRVLVVDLREPVPPLHVPGADLVAVEAEGLRQRLAFDPTATTAAEVLAGVSRLAEVRDLSVEEPDVADVVRQLYASARR
ncbi:ATP-binding cassette domain-containing protein [Paenibacillus sp. TRM 82003]|uniref:ABC transporter ATP-binding protein n=1 Tax=Kineococcus sp. TRM81007 TaxID=2925831 RepID=UPI001F59FBC0|nr:ATP-binding cassette domain-containing protein [Kineococcus sp. TRM81007]MCI2237146.1 ATP-binding cassette domain-containing protein [Kineococcus sp. TRM81007]MCI3925267.1 ATP-binding cassette domain-containing protein [Paenibacillus sp. TRM 82003]